jgi:hypothetical protein
MANTYTSQHPLKNISDVDLNFLLNVQHIIPKASYKKLLLLGVAPYKDTKVMECNGLVLVMYDWSYSTETLNKIRNI